jgi:hypothetical protein
MLGLVGLDAWINAWIYYTSYLFSFFLTFSPFFPSSHGLISMYLYDDAIDDSPKKPKYPELRTLRQMSELDVEREGVGEQSSGGVGMAAAGPGVAHTLVLQSPSLLWAQPVGTHCLVRLRLGDPIVVGEPGVEHSQMGHLNGEEEAAIDFFCPR